MDAYIAFRKTFGWATPHMMQDPDFLKYLEQNPFDPDEDDELIKIDSIYTLRTVLTVMEDMMKGAMDFYSDQSLRNQLINEEDVEDEEVAQSDHRYLQMTRIELLEEVTSMMHHFIPVGSICMGMPGQRDCECLDPVDLARLAAAFGVSTQQLPDQIIRGLQTKFREVQRLAAQASIGKKGNSYQDMNQWLNANFGPIPTPIGPRMG